ncbi:hypothetical protein [Litorilituus sediminis]|uniref:Uncharacterized protein n=1 Tax=Litorilituus sediminis TaxID=718192 RepID=A0A4P6PAY0_9GAMM|nr:hypothetical protein [Litorilituus sediminis]QBG36825.1 hypothetical protein EMK97_14400 [Litorilituus sediminis]
MKHILLALILMSTTVMAEEEVVSVDFVADSYAYCVEYAQGEENTENAILQCVNAELEASGYKRFKSVKEIKDFIKKK